MALTTVAPIHAVPEDASGRGHPGLGVPAWARSARTRLAVAMLALLAISSLVSVLALRQILISRTGDRVDRALEQEVREFQRLASLGRDPRTGRPFGNDIRAVFEVFLARNVPAVGEAFFTFVNGVPFRSSSNRSPDDELISEIEALGRRTRLRITAAGGVSAASDLARLAALEPFGVDEAIMGKALYEGRVTLAAAHEAVAAAGRR